jgi:hypothetical protein
MLLQQRLKEAKHPNAELWVIDQEPPFHFELQATEEVSTHTHTHAHTHVYMCMCS